MAHRDLLGLPQGQLGSPINCWVSSSTGNLGTLLGSGAGTWTNIAALKVTTNCSGDYPVILQIVSDGSGNDTSLSANVSPASGGTEPFFRIQRDGVTIFQTQFFISGNGSYNFPPHNIFHMDLSPSKGTHTYQVQWSGQGNIQLTVNYLCLVAYENRNLILK